jgi:tetratricopeptide (TPR) repeat protein
MAMTEKSLLLNPNSPGAWQANAVAHACCGETESALDRAERARRHNPLDPLAWFYSSIIGFIYFWAGHYEEAARAIEEILKKQPNFPPALRMQIATYGLLGRTAEGTRASSGCSRSTRARPWLRSEASSRSFSAGIPPRSRTCSRECVCRDCPKRRDAGQRRRPCLRVPPGVCCSRQRALRSGDESFSPLAYRAMPDQLPTGCATRVSTSAAAIALYSHAGRAADRLSGVLPTRPRLRAVPRSTAS